MDPELKAYLDERFALMIEHFTRVDEQFAGVHGRLDVHDRKFEEHDRRLDLLAEALVRIEHRLERARIA